MQIEIDREWIEIELERAREDLEKRLGEERSGEERRAEESRGTAFEI